MKYIKLFESFDESDLLDIEDIFKDIADEWYLEKIDSDKLEILINNYIRFGRDDDQENLINKYCFFSANSTNSTMSGIFSGIGSEKVDLFICNPANIDKEKFKETLSNFVNRCNGIGYVVNNVDCEDYDDFQIIKIKFNL